MEIRNIALGSTGIAAAREELGNIEKAVQNARGTNERFITYIKMVIFKNLFLKQHEELTQMIN